MSTVVQRELVEWYTQWGQISFTRDQITNLNRGPFRDFQLNFLLRLARSNSFIETFRTNVYLQEVDENLEGDFMEKEINTALFADKLAKLKELEEECNRIQGSADDKHAKLRKKRMETSTNGSYVFQRQYYNILDERLRKTSDVVAECEQLISSNRDEGKSTSKEGGNGSHIPALTEAAHLAFQTVVMRHYLCDDSSPRAGSGSLRADDFRALVISMCEEFTQRLIKQNQQIGLQQNLRDKMNELIISWSTAHVQAFFKNKSREKLLLEAKQSLEAAQQACRNEPNIGYRLSDFLGLIRNKYLSAKVERCRQHNNRSGQPLENIFRNISTDRFSTPSPENDIDNMFVNLRRQWNMRDWVIALSDVEQVEEIYSVLLKTWNLAKRNLMDMISFAQQPSNELLSNFLSTAECIRVTFPKPFVHKPATFDRPRYNSELQSILSGSTLSGTSNISILDTTCVSAATTTILDSLSESRMSSSTKDSSSDSNHNDFQEFYSLYDQIGDNNKPENETAVQNILDKLKLRFSKD
ncbi:unnamed protein product [Allacma fusca]|uniref:Uncharacterized protein n=1 Tax=Allacma fusca TaxID=39272 RepID=A0A8J2JKW6_9HEXA|nr:unnamed protein product [Allacma fusca]